MIQYLDYSVLYLKEKVTQSVAVSCVLLSCDRLLTHSTQLNSPILLSWLLIIGFLFHQRTYLFNPICTQLYIVMKRRLLCF